MERQQIVKVSVEVQNGAARFRVGVQAKSIRKALGLVGARYPGSEVRVSFPIDPDHFIVDGLARAGIVETEHPEKVAS